jgi:hypothetical protein
VAGNSTDDAAFEGWVEWVFNHPVTEPAWYQDENAERWAASPVVVLNNITRLFEESPVRLAVFSDAEADQGLWFLAFGYFDQGLSTLGRKVFCTRNASGASAQSIYFSSNTLQFGVRYARRMLISQRRILRTCPVSCGGICFTITPTAQAVESAVRWIPTYCWRWRES